MLYTNHSYLIFPTLLQPKSFMFFVFFFLLALVYMQKDKRERLFLEERVQVKEEPKQSKFSIKWHY